MSPAGGPGCLTPADLSGLRGVLAVLEAHLLAGDLPQHVVRRLAAHLDRDGLLPPPGDEVAVREALTGLDERLRAALDEAAPEPG